MLLGLIPIILLIVVGLVVILLIFANTADLPSVNLGTVMLDCPHCGRETPSHLETCQQCGKSFRDSVVNPKLPLPPAEVQPSDQVSK